MNRRKDSPSRQRSPRYEPAVFHNKSSIAEREVEDLTRESPGRERQAMAFDPKPNDNENNMLEFEKELATLNQEKLTVSILLS